MTLSKAALLLMLSTSALFAHSGATGIVKERMDGMGVLAAAMKSLVGMQKTGTYAAPALSQAARDLQAHSGQTMLDRFPSGSLPMVSEASPAIWEDWAGFAAIAQRLHVLSTGLETAAQDGLTGRGTVLPQGPLTQTDLTDLSVATLIDGIGETCSACHKSYRIKK